MIDYNVFGLSEGAGDGEIENAYAALKKKYRADMFLEGEAGAEGARSFERLDAEYKKHKSGKEAAKEIPKTQSKQGGTVSHADLSHIEEIVKAGKITEAQDALDNIVERGAEWHFVQALVYYKKSWFLECRKQLEIAMKMEPENKKYKDNYLSLLAYSEIMQQKMIAEEEKEKAAAAKGGDCCSGNSGSCTAPCISDCCFKDDEK